MKPSHFTTPRTMEDAVFQPWGQAIYASETRRYDWQDRVVLIGAAVIGIATAVILVVTA